MMTLNQKIELINQWLTESNLSKAVLAEYLDISERELKARLKRKNISACDWIIICHVFWKPCEFNKFKRNEDGSIWKDKYGQVCRIPVDPEEIIRERDHARYLKVLELDNRRQVKPHDLFVPWGTIKEGDETVGRETEGSLL